ncbi:arginine metabolism regulation protein II [Exophiala dermatitidis]|uniref:Arginine metabolism regulation protein II n=2 Tax=Exophiala dermatitidis TaxID=5970 RepID=H6C553_EXODN|nr:arginine metabolism regulation protein II [Exophiala dermatitidis NIH/UT8656]KAJ4505482.1 arginine metabolism regulation protein II [Exophiala dermatitidis]EHY59765.1 arginine metabolism regulation protein II [Exophiala dermatitidis NIH/UT8656]KAJ4507085.1 arginine metabolism regulation protein II [Exophiala dermatitidis]KAJ4507681.1 arginine metabolism regulation protein II [Exophiala dermatitidis]KAJ4533016.1 arginine metabolism regulation protein II [Exophiala dermatitidis]
MPQSTKISKPKRATKTFSGCWTCRERHVKCDEGRPTCARCIRGGFVCHGYGIKLVWIDPETRGWERKIRRLVSAPALYHDKSPFLQVDVQEALDRLDQGDICSVGPFSVFPIEEELNHSVLKVATDVEKSNQIKTAYVLRWLRQMMDDFHEQENITSPTSHVSTPAEARSPCIYRHVDLLPRPAEQRQLIHHWVTFVSWHLVPVDHPDNPFRSVFTPMALAGLNSVSHESNGQIALFHSLCATSAYSRGQFLGNNKTLTLAGKHYHLAILHLRHSLANLTGDNFDSQRNSIIATITMFSVMDMITGRSTEWRTHVQGGASLLASIEDRIWNEDKNSSMIYQSYLAVAALCNIDLPSTIDMVVSGSKHYVLDQFFGLARPILRHIVRINALLKDTRAADLDPDLVEDLESELWAHNPENLDFDGLEDSRNRTMARHHAFLFYYASLIHFQRTVRQMPPSTMQHLVRQAVEHFEEIERLGADTVGCTLIWPPLVVACECESSSLRERMLAWYKMKRRHGFMNLEISKDVAQEVWRRRRSAATATDVHWQDVLEEMNLDIVLA